MCKKPDVYWQGTKTCQLCGDEEPDEINDAATDYGWALVCNGCFDDAQCRLGMGRGQRYKRQEDGRYLKIA